MRTPVLMSAALALALLLVVGGCDSKKEGTQPPKPDVETAAPAVPAPTAPATENLASVEVGCAMCIYKVAGVSSCLPAVKVGEKVLLISGWAPPGHDLCGAAKKATVEGKIEGDKFVATRVEFLP